MQTSCFFIFRTSICLQYCTERQSILLCPVHEILTSGNFAVQREGSSFVFQSIIKFWTNRRWERNGIFFFCTSFIYQAIPVARQLVHSFIDGQMLWACMAVAASQGNFWFSIPFTTLELNQWQLWKLKLWTVEIKPDSFSLFKWKIIMFGTSCILFNI